MSTTVIEVGVDVGNATMMVILDADRFGISQLHQLRGRVGRGGHPGLCLLVTPAAPRPRRGAARAPWRATTDGFELAELDLEIRREGDVLGTDQSGRRSTLRLLSVVRDVEVVERGPRGGHRRSSRATPTLPSTPALAVAGRGAARARRGRLPGEGVTRIIGGSAGGRRLQTPPGDPTRPTSDRIARGALLRRSSPRSASWSGVRVLDLYAGSGAVGLEALSRGAEPRRPASSSDRRTAALIRRNAATLGLPAARWMPGAVAAYLDGEPSAPYDVVFLDPPYALPGRAA